MMKDYIYVDNAATTRMSDLAVEAMIPYFKESFGNASSLYKLGRDNHQALEKARKVIASLIHAHPMEIYFTSGGTEADNWAIRGILKKYQEQGKNHMITTTIEHHAILHTCQSLQQEGFEVTYLSVNQNGQIDLEELKHAIRPQTALVSIMYANNEIGTLLPIDKIGQICHEKDVLFHTDAVQAIGTIPIDVQKNNIDLLSASAHKFHGPKGIGFLYCRKGVKLAHLLEGGAQERGYRPGTENIAYIVSMATALNEACQMMEEKAKRIQGIRDYIQKEVLMIPGTYLNGDEDHRLPGILNISFENIDGESLLFELDLKGIAVSTGSACASGSVEPSHVLLALGRPYHLAQGTLRISIGRYNTFEEAQRIVMAINEAIKYLRGE